MKVFFKGILFFLKALLSNIFIMGVILVAIGGYLVYNNYNVKEKIDYVTQEAKYYGKFIINEGKKLINQVNNR